METRPDTHGAGRRLALAAERATQGVLRAVHRVRTAVGGAGRVLAAEDFRGEGRCHCAAGQSPHFVHSEALREACDFVLDEGSNVRSRRRPQVAAGRLGPLAGGLPAGATVHVKTDHLGLFVREVLPRVRRPVVLVTGDADAAPLGAHGALLEHPMIAHWFAQNCDRTGRHPRLTRVPIGVDNPVFTKLEKRLGFALTMALGRSPWDATCCRNDMGDQAELQRVRTALPPPGVRPVRVLCTFHQNQKLIRPDLGALPARAEAWRALSGNPACHFPARRLRQRACWELHGEFAFEVSPHGNGLDCFRTWEALLLGTIPIVRRSTLDPLYEDEGFPVVVVDEWNEITPANLGRWREAHAGAFTPELARRLGADYWIAKIKTASQSARNSGG